MLNDLRCPSCGFVRNGEVRAMYPGLEPECPEWVTDERQCGVEMVEVPGQVEAKPGQVEMFGG